VSLALHTDLLTDGALVRDTLAGDPRAFRLLVQRYEDRFLRYALRVVGNREDAEEALQGAFVRAHRSLGECRDPERFGAWLHRIVANECRTKVTRSVRRLRRFVDDEGALAAVPAPDRTGDAVLRVAIEDALARLPLDQREAFVLKYVEGMEYEEMAEVTGAGVSALKMRVKRACERLRELLAGVVHD
jgi:RNA polymerase sigma-70 factor, ECF subfamily